MQRVLVSLAVIVVVGAALAFSGGQPGGNRLQIASEERNPFTHLKVNQHADDFQFAIVSDRTGGHRANVFSQAVEKLNLLQPAFVISVGDLIEGGGKKSAQQLQAEWREFDGFVSRLQMPFFYVAGNHDVGAPATAKAWQEKLGRSYYHFVHRNVLFLMLNSDDPPGSNGNIAKEQQAYARKVLGDNAQVRWTIVIVHRPVWTGKVAQNGWEPIEEALKDRPCTVFAGHVHRYKKFVRQGRNYYQLATTGGGSLLRGPEHGEFDHIAWVTMKKDGPLLANVLIEAVLTEDLHRPTTDEPVAPSKQIHPVRGKAFFEGRPLAGAEVVLQPVQGSRAKKAFGEVGIDGTFELTTNNSRDGAMAGEYHVTLTMKKDGPKIPERYADAARSELRATIVAGPNELVLELKR